jgi:hypothetical protein
MRPLQGHFLLLYGPYTQGQAPGLGYTPLTGAVGWMDVVYVGASPYARLFDPVGVFIYTLIYILITLSASAVFLYFLYKKLWLLAIGHWLFNNQ